MSFLSNWIGSQIFGSNSPQEYAQPIGPGLLGSPDYSGDGYSPGALRPNFGVLSPQMPSFDQYNQDRHSFSGIMGALSGGRPGLVSALGQAFAPDSFSVPGYNALLGQGQGIETNRLNLAPWEDPQGVAQAQAAFASPQQMKAPATMFGQTAPSQPSASPAASGFGFGGQAAAAQPTGALPGQQIAPDPALGEAPPDQRAAEAPPSAPALIGTAPNMLDAKTIAARIAFLSRSPAGIALAKPYVEMLNDLNKLGTGFDANNNQIVLPNAANVKTELALANKGLSTGGVNPGSQASVNAAVAAQERAVKGAGADAGNQSDLFYKPKIAGGEEAAKFPYKIVELKPDQTAGTPGQLGIVPFGNLGGSNPLGNLGTFDPGSAAGAGKPPPPAAGLTSEQIERGKELGKASGELDTAAKAAQEMRSRVQFIQREMPKAMVGSIADKKAELGRILIGIGVPKATVDEHLGNVSSADVLQKEFYRLSTDQVKGLGREPGYILDKISSANPNLETQPEAMTLMTHAIDQGAQRTLDKRDARDAWLADPKHLKSLAGFDAAFDKSNPQDMYVNRAYQRTDEEPDGSKLIGTVDGHRLWLLPNGRKVIARHN